MAPAPFRKGEAGSMQRMHEAVRAAGNMARLSDFRSWMDELFYRAWFLTKEDRESLRLFHRPRAFRPWPDVEALA